MSVAEAKKNWNVGELLNWSINYLSEKQFENPRLNVEWLLCHTLQCKRIDLYTNYDRPLDKIELDQFKTQLLRRVGQEPLQYIVGSAEFMGLTFEVNADVLIPRPDTETLVERTLEICKENKQEAVHVLDIGTGCGAISVALVYYLEKYSIPCSLTALDISEKALEVARRNSENILGKEKINFVRGNILEENTIKDLYHSFDVIVSNPPYISDEEYSLLPSEVKNHEPEIALKAADNGFVFYNHIVKTAKTFFRSNLTKKYVIFEVGYNQAPEVSTILTNRGFDVRVYKDYHQVDRVISGRLNEQN